MGWVLFGIVSSIAASYALLSRDVSDIKDKAKIEAVNAAAVNARLSRIEFVLCATEDPLRNRACERLQLVREP